MNRYFIAMFMSLMLFGCQPSTFTFNPGLPSSSDPGQENNSENSNVNTQPGDSLDADSNAQTDGKADSGTDVDADNETAEDSSTNADSEPTTGSDKNPNAGSLETMTKKRLQSLADPDLCLAATSDNHVTTADCTDRATLNWTFSNGHIQPDNDLSQCLGVSHLQSYAVPVLSLCGSTEQHQNWIVQQNSWLIDGYALDLNRSTGEVILYSAHFGANQQWTLIEPMTAEDTVTPNESESATNDYQGWAWVSSQVGDFYGEKTFQVKAARNWVNTGLFLKAGESASISAQGQWRVNGTQNYGPDGHSSRRARDCAEGALIARIGLYYKDTAIHCIGSGGQITADKDGIVYVGAVVSNDLGEAYEARKDADGEIEVTVRAFNGLTVPIIAAAEAYAVAYDQIPSGWVEIRSDNIIVTLPTDTAEQDKALLPSMMQRLQAIYDSHKSLRGMQPYHGQPIRFFPDTSDAPGWMLAGNPIRLDPALVDKTKSSRITRVAEPGVSGWGFSHELGHDYNFAGGAWYYTTFGGLEAWPNVFSYYTEANLNLPPRDIDCSSRKAAYLAKNAASGSFGDPWDGVCFLLEFKDVYGWNVFKNFYQIHNVSGKHGWTYFYQSMNQASGKETRPIFDSWNVKF